nr:restriction endonuclease subunit S [Treponema sp.]
MKKYKLDEIAIVEISGVDKKTKDNEIPVRLCNFTDVYHNWAITKEMTDSFLKASANQKEINTLSLKKGQVAFTKDSETRDDIGIPTYIADDFENVVLGYHTALITPDKSKLSGKYLNAFMNTRYIQKYFENNASGSGQRYTLSTETLNAIPVIAPDLQTQEKIGDVFSNIDKKIALNRHMNAKLEQMAKRLYDHWFVQFDFPNEDGKPYKASGGKMEYNEVLKREIPAGWEVKNVCTIANILPGGTPSKANCDFWNGELPFFGPTDYEGNVFQLHTAEKITALGLSKCASLLFEENTIIITARGSVGKLIIVGTPMAMNQSCYALRAKDITTYEYLYFLTIQLIESLKVKSTGSVFKSIITSDIENSMLVIPPMELIKKYCGKVSSLFSSIKLNTQETQKLTALRDRLLPLLMNGQVEVD